MRIKDGNGIEQEIKNQVGKIVNDTLFLWAQSIIREVKETRGKKGGGKNIYLLSRKLIYRASGRWFIGYNRGKGGCGYRHKKFIDSKTGIEYPNIEISASVLDEFVWEYVKLAIEKPKEFYAIYQKQTAQDDELQNLLSSQEKWIESISEHEVYLISLEDEYIRWKISEARKEDLNDRYEWVIRESKIKLTESNERIAKLVEAKTASDALERFSKNFKTKINNLSIEEKQTLVDTLVECIEVQKTEGKILADIYFRFAQSRIESEGVAGEPKDGFQTLKSPLSETRSEHMEVLTGSNLRTFIENYDRVKEKYGKEF